LQCGSHIATVQSTEWTYDRITAATEQQSRVDGIQRNSAIASTTVVVSTLRSNYVYNSYNAVWQPQSLSAEWTYEGTLTVRTYTWRYRAWREKQSSGSRTSEAHPDQQRQLASMAAAKLQYEATYEVANANNS
jgi:hypothetical protein